MPRALVAILTALALVAAIPAAGIAQDAGSNQYQDPLAGEPGTGGGGGGSGGGGGGGGGGGNGSPSSGTQGVQGQSDAANDTTAAATPARDQLPATGSDSWLLALAGVTLLGGGLGLRRVATRPTV